MNGEVLTLYDPALLAEQLRRQGAAGGSTALESIVLDGAAALRSHTLGVGLGDGARGEALLDFLGRVLLAGVANGPADECRQCHEGGHECFEASHSFSSWTQ